MQKKRKFSLHPAWLFLAGLLTGFGAGYGAKDLREVPRQITPASAPLRQAAESHVVCFTPNKHCQSLIIQEIGKAKNTIFVQAYAFTDFGIAQALVQAKQRGVEVKALLDKSNRKDAHSAKNLLLHNGIPVRFDSPPGIAHNKLILIDGQTVIGGSYNYSQSAWKRNTENLLIIRSPSLASQYIQNWSRRWEVSLPPSPAPQNRAPQIK